MMNLSGWSGNNLLRKDSPVLSPLLQRYKWLSVRFCTTEKIFRSLKGYTDMFYNRSSFSLVALLLLFSPSSILLPFSAAFDHFFFSHLPLFPQISHRTFPLLSLRFFHIKWEITQQCQIQILRHRLLFQCSWAKHLTCNCSTVAVHWLTAENGGGANWCWKRTSALSKPSEEEFKERKTLQ